MPRGLLTTKSPEISSRGMVVSSATACRWPFVEPAAHNESEGAGTANLFGSRPPIAPPSADRQPSVLAPDRWPFVATFPEALATNDWPTGFNI
jgi:hypothetical protein